MNTTAMTFLQPVDFSPINSLDAYIHHVNQIPVLTEQEEQQLALRLRSHNDLDAARQLVLAHARYVVRIAKGYKGYGLPLGDLIQEGNIGLMKAVKRFNPDMGTRLVTFAVHWIKAEIHEFILRNWRIVKIATTKAQRKLFFNLRSMKKRLNWFTSDEINAVANDLGVKPQTVRDMEMRLSQPDASFDGYDDEEENPYTTFSAPVAYLEDQQHTAAETTEHNDWREQSTIALEKALVAIDPRSQEILNARWLNEKKSTLQELADKYAISAERVRQLEKLAMQKLKIALNKAMA